MILYSDDENSERKETLFNRTWRNHEFKESIEFNNKTFVGHKLGTNYADLNIEFELCAELKAH